MKEIPRRRACHAVALAKAGWAQSSATSRPICRATARQKSQWACGLDERREARDVRKTGRGTNLAASYIYCPMSSFHLSSHVPRLTPILPRRCVPATACIGNAEHCSPIIVLPESTGDRRDPPFHIGLNKSHSRLSANVSTHCRLC